MSRTHSLLLCLVCLVVSGCHGAKVESLTTSAAAAAAPAVSTVSEPAHTPGPAPGEGEVRQAIVRNYENAVTIDNSLPRSFLVGDFNGDKSEDIAVVVKPSRAKLPELNSEFVNWILEDPRQTARPRINGDDLLLAVIHGVDREGWRNKTAKQTFLLKNAVGTEFATQQGRELDKKFPRLQGDVIREKLDGTAGIIFWTGGRYAWHPVT